MTTLLAAEEVRLGGALAHQGYADIAARDGHVAQEPSVAVDGVERRVALEADARPGRREPQERPPRGPSVAVSRAPARRSGRGARACRR